MKELKEELIKFKKWYNKQILFRGCNDEFLIDRYLDSIKEPIKQEGIEEAILLPNKLTSENGAKDLLRGEFVEIFHYERFEQPYIVPIKWDTIKKIYNKIVEHYK